MFWKQWWRDRGFENNWLFFVLFQGWLREGKTCSNNLIFISLFQDGLDGMNFQFERSINWIEASTSYYFGSGPMSVPPARTRTRTHTHVYIVSISTVIIVTVQEKNMSFFFSVSNFLVRFGLFSSIVYTCQDIPSRAKTFLVESKIYLIQTKTYVIQDGTTF